MTVESWLAAAIADADRRGLAPLKPLLETLARSTAALRAADRTLREDGAPEDRPQDGKGSRR
jgi:hypothetical protein